MSMLHSMTTTVSSLLLAAFIAAPAWAVEGAKPKVEKATKEASKEGSEFFIERGLVDKLYDNSVTAQKSGVQANGDARIDIQVGVLSPTAMRVENEYFVVDHAGNLGSLPFLSFTTSKRVLTRGPSDFYVEGTVGYATRQADYTIDSSTGITVEDTIALQWLPVAARARVERRLGSITWVRPSLALGGGASWIHQSGTLEGVDQSHWVPTYVLAPGLTFFAGAPTEDSPFGGIDVEAALRRGSTSAAALEGWSFSLGSRFLL